MHLDLKRRADVSTGLGYAVQKNRSKEGRSAVFIKNNFNQAKTNLLRISEKRRLHETPRYNKVAKKCSAYINK